MKKKFLIYFSLFLGFLVVTTQITMAHGTHYPEIDTSYNNQMISNVGFGAKDAMTEAQIQQFLVDKGSVLANYTIPTDGSVGTTIGWNFAVEGKGWTAAKVIYESAQWYGINPQVLLATLEKESSLVDSGNFDNLTYAMGYACLEDGSTNNYYNGFARQMDGAAYQLWYNFKYSELKDSRACSGGVCYYAGDTVIVDGKNTYIANSATAAFYRYTPHRPDSAWLTATNGSHYYGNYSFIFFFNKWFDVGRYIQNALKVSYSYSLSNYSPAVGEEVTATVTIHNNSPVSVTTPAIGIASWYNYPQFNPRDIGFVSYTFASNETKSFEFKKIFTEVGYYRSWVSFLYNGQWYQALNESGHYTTRDFNTHKPDIRVTPITLNPTTPLVGQNVTASTTVRNYEPNPIKLSLLGIANWSNYPNFSPADFGFNANQTLAAYGDAGGKDILTLNYTRTFVVIGNNFCSWFSFLIGDKWYGILEGTEKYFRVTSN